MGDVVSLARRACRCGWEYPSAILVVVSEPIRVPYAVRLTCPRCGAEAETRTVPGTEPDPK